MDKEGNTSSWTIAVLIGLLIWAYITIGGKNTLIEEQTLTIDEQASMIEAQTEQLKYCEEALTEANSVITTAADEIDWLQTRLGRSYYDFVYDIDSLTTPETVYTDDCVY
jgi:hypothetical protein